MDIPSIRPGQKIRIQGKLYEVLYVNHLADVRHDDGGPHVRKYTELALHDMKSGSLEPTHTLQHYADTQEFFLMGDRKERIERKELTPA